MSIASSNLLKRVASVVASISRRHTIDGSFGPTDSLVDGGMTSVAMVELMLAVECEFDLTIPDSELCAANFFSVSTLAALVLRLNATCGSATVEYVDAP